MRPDRESGIAAAVRWHGGIKVEARTSDVPWSAGRRSLTSCWGFA